MKKVLDLLSNQDRSPFLPKLMRELSDMKILAAKSLIQSQKARNEEILNDLCQAEFKVFSQWGDDGIIQFLINYLDIPEKTFVEFGVENYTEANTRFLLENDNWQGLILDGSEEHMNTVKADSIYWRHALKAKSAFVTAENINDLPMSNGFKGQIGLLHIDVDGNDYWIWKAISAVDPVIVIVEYNSLFGNKACWTVPYAPEFTRTKAHYSNLYWGVSISSLCNLAEEKGYEFIGSNSNGNNAYFVKKDRMKSLKALSPEQGYKISRFKEGRDSKGKLTFMDFDERFEQIKGLQVFNTLSQEVELIA